MTTQINESNSAANDVTEWKASGYIRMQHLEKDKCREGKAVVQKRMIDVMHSY